MQISCSICNDLFDQQSEIAVIPCGHVYHEACISQWFKTQATCPKCRCRVEQSSMHKIYFDVDSEGDSCLKAYQKRVDEMLTELQEKDFIIKLLNDDNKRIQERNESLEDDVKNYQIHEHLYKTTIAALEKKVESYKLNNHDLKEKLKEKTSQMEVDPKVYVTPLTSNSSNITVKANVSNKENMLVIDLTSPFK